MIEDLEQLLELKNDEKIVAKNIKCLTAPGENYGSLMLSVNLEIKSDRKKTEEINVVAKTLPLNPEMQEMFNCPVTFTNEMAIYRTIIPLLRNFIKEKGVERTIKFAAEYRGSRPNLHGNGTKIDNNAVLLLENLKLNNFTNLERTLGFDLNAAKLVLDNLAHLHAIPIALKLEKPKIFDEKIRPFLSPLLIPKEIYSDWQEKYTKITHSLPELEEFRERLDRVDIRIYPSPVPREPWGTISHNDCWVNNIMVRLENDIAVETKLVDFQICDYGSPAKDVLFFLFSSVSNSVLEKNYEELVLHYHKTFSSILQDFSCDLSDFSLENFLKELDFEAKRTQFAHTALMLFPIFAPKLQVKDMSELKPSDIGNTEPTDLHKEKLIFIAQQYAKRNWI